MDPLDLHACTQVPVVQQHCFRVAGVCRTAPLRDTRSQGAFRRCKLWGTLMALVTERTSFTLDVLGRYTANIWQEVIDSQDQALDSHARPFDIFIVGGGTFGTALASRLHQRPYSCPPDPAYRGRTS